MPDESQVSLKAHIDALSAQRDRYEDIIRALEQRGADNIASWLKEKSDLHNNILRAWEKASADDRANFVKLATFQALSDKFEVNTTTTAKALTLAEGKNKGYAAVVASVTFIAGVIVASVALWTFLHR